MFGNPLFSTPKNELKRLGDCCHINPRRSNILLNENDLVSFVPMSAVNENGYIDGATDEEYGKVKKGFTCFENDDVLFAKITPCMENGKGAVAEGLTNGIGMGSTEFHILRPIKGISNPYWLLALTRMPIFRERAAKNMSGTGGQRRVGSAFLENFTIGLPSISEQETFEAIYKQADKSKFSNLKSQFIEMFDKVKDNKYGYMSYRLSDCCSYISDGSHYSPKEDPNGQYPMLSVKDMTEKGFTYKDCKYISKEEYDKLVANGCKPEINDVLVAKDGSYFKYSFALIEAREQAVLSSIAILRPNPAIVDSRYLAYYMLTPEVIRLVEQNYLTGTAIKRVILKGFKEIPVLTPPLDKQQEFVSILQQADKSKLIQNTLLNNKLKFCYCYTPRHISS